jgi:hypothetical protein
MSLWTELPGHIKFIRRMQFRYWAIHSSAYTHLASGILKLRHLQMVNSFFLFQLPQKVGETLPKCTSDQQLKISHAILQLVSLSASSAFRGVCQASDTPSRVNASASFRSTMIWFFCRQIYHTLSPSLLQQFTSIVLNGGMAASSLSAKKSSSDSLNW